MSLPRPEPGLVIRYAYLWRREAERGEEAGRKQRPCAIIVAAAQRGGDVVVYAAPITHSPPRDSWAGLPLPSATRGRLRLDAEPSWIVTTEFNSFRWPGVDLAPISPATRPDDVVFGMLPQATTARLIEMFRENVRLARVRAVKRTE